MTSKKAIYISWIVFMAALLAWSVGGFFAWSMFEARNTHFSARFASAQEGIKYEEGLRTRTLARKTVKEREALDSLVDSDIIAIVESIEAAGESVRVKVEIGQALVDTSVSSALEARAVNIVVEAEGSFASLVHVSALLYSLPIPSEVSQLRLERVPEGLGSSKEEWRLVAHIRILTTAAISS